MKRVRVNGGKSAVLVLVFGAMVTMVVQGNAQTITRCPTEDEINVLRQKRDTAKAEADRIWQARWQVNASTLVFDHQS
jgi:hypothetical protein